IRRAQRSRPPPDRAAWSAGTRGAYIRVLGGPGDPATHLENRLGEPAANPYLYMASQLIAGLDGIDHKTDPRPMTDNPHDPALPPLPATLRQAIDTARTSGLLRAAAGDAFVDYYTRLKDNEWRRYAEAAAGRSDDRSAVTEWEQREYFRIY